MAIDLDDLAPYKSLIICTSPTNWRAGDAIKELKQLATSLPDVRDVYDPSGPATRKGLSISVFHYCVERAPFWLKTGPLRDLRHELVMIIKRGRRVLLLSSEGRFRDRIAKTIGVDKQKMLGRLELLSSRTLNAAFVRGKTRALWLTSTQRRMPSKPDKKSLAGPDLLYALDPLGDQGFAFSSAVSELPAGVYRTQVGVSPRKSQFWAGASEDFDAFTDDVNALLDIVESSTTPVENPLPVLATAVDDSASIAGISDAYAAALIPSELLSPGIVADQDMALAERWSRLEFDVAPTAGMDFRAKLSWSDGSGTSEQLGCIEITFDAANPASIVWDVRSVSAPPGSRTLHDEAVSVLQQHREWLHVWFGTGHSLLGQSLYAGRFRDMPFEHSWADFTGFNISKEKPNPLTIAQIGAQDSLFCWVRQRWTRSLTAGAPATGWLGCSDGSMEIADFIHFDVVAGVPELSLIHVKAAGNAAANRSLAISDYEIVVSQAVKNLRFLDLQVAATEMTQFLNAKLLDAVWEAGTQRTRARMLAVMDRSGTNYLRRVVIVQPRTSRTSLIAARGASATSKNKRISQQLDTLLLGAKANCISLGAEFIVIGDQT